MADNKPAESYMVRVRYRTATTCNEVVVSVVACSTEQALKLASIAARRRRPRIIRVDGGEIMGAPQTISQGA